MSSLPPLSVTVNAKKWSCVLDTSLALSRHGLLLALRLGEEFNLWLVRELWQILDNTQYYLSHPEIIMPAGSGDLSSGGAENKGGGLLHQTLSQWELARIQTDIAGLNVFWIGDAVRESLFPQGINPDLIFRFETLAASLEERIVRQGAPGGDAVVTDCCRDAAALTAALTPHKGFILAHHGPQSAASAGIEPHICSRLKAWGIPCHRVEPESKTRIEREFLDPALGRAGISELSWAGLNLAVVHVVVPNAVVMPPVAKSDDDFTEGLENAMGDGVLAQMNWWDGAAGFWYPL